MTVTQYDDYVSFENKRSLMSNAENNPADAVLTEEQKSLAVSLMFEDRDHFTLGMHNYAKWPRNHDGGHLKQAVGRSRHSVANTPSHGEQPNAKPDTQPNLCIFCRFGTVHCGVRLHQQPNLPWGLLCE